MAFDAGAITSTIGINLNPFAQGMLQAEGIAQLFPSIVTQFLGNPLLAVVGVAEKAAHSIQDAFIHVSQSAHQLGIDAQRAGVSASWLYGVGGAAKESGSSVEELAHSIAFLNKNAGDAAQGNETAQIAFLNLGVSFLDASGKIKDTQSLFYDVADAISKLPGPAAKTDAALALLNRGGIEMLPMLQKGSSGIKSLAAEMDRASGGVGQDVVEMSEAVVHLNAIWEEAWAGIEQALAKPFLKEVAKHGDEIKEAMIGAAEAVRGRLFTAITVAVEYVEANLPKIKAELPGIEKDLIAIGEVMANWLPTLKTTVGFLHDVAWYMEGLDLQVHGPKDKDNAYLKPVPNPGNLGGLAGGAVVHAPLDGLVQLAKIQADYDTAADKLKDVLSQVASGKISVTGNMDIEGAQLAANPQSAAYNKANAANAVASFGQYRTAIENAQLAVQELQMRFAAGEKITPADMDDAIAKMQRYGAFVARLQAQLQNLTNESDRFGTFWQQFFNKKDTAPQAPELDVALHGINAALDHARQMALELRQHAQAPFNFGDFFQKGVSSDAHSDTIGALFNMDTAAALASQSIIDVKNGVVQFTASNLDLSNGMRGSLIPAFADAAVSVRSFYSDMKDLNDEYSRSIDLKGSVSNAVGSFDASQSGSLGVSPVTINAPITMPPIDTDAATSQLAAKLLPAARNWNDLVLRQFAAAASAGRVLGGL